MWASIVLNAVVSAVCLYLLLMARRHKAGLTVPGWLPRYGGALAFVGMTAALIAPPLLQNADPSAMGHIHLQTPLLWAFHLAAMPAIFLSLTAMMRWVQATRPGAPRWLALWFALAFLVINFGAGIIAVNQVERKYTEIERRSETANTLLNAGQYPQAAAEFRKVVALDPTSGVDSLRLGIGLYHMGHYEEAARSLQTALANEKLYFHDSSVEADANHYLFLIRSKVGW